MASLNDLLHFLREILQGLHQICLFDGMSVCVHSPAQKCAEFVGAVQEMMIAFAYFTECSRWLTAHFQAEVLFESAGTIIAEGH